MYLYTNQTEVAYWTPAYGWRLTANTSDQLFLLGFLRGNTLDRAYARTLGQSAYLSRKGYSFHEEKPDFSGSLTEDEFAELDALLA